MIGINKEKADKKHPWAARVFTGEVTIPELNKLQVSDILDDVRVINCAKWLRVGDLGEFLGILRAQPVTNFGYISYCKLLAAIDQFKPGSGRAPAPRTAEAAKAETISPAWLEKYERLQAYREEKGHCNPSVSKRAERQLAMWLVAQRVAHKKGKLTPARTSLLDRLGVIWDWKSRKTDATWLKWLGELRKFKEKHGHCRVPRTHPNRPFASWIWIQRIRRDKTYGKAAQLTAEQVAMLDALGFIWDPREHHWAEMFDRLKTHKARHGHCDPQDDAELARWVSGQRQYARKGLLSPGNRELLEEIGFTWESQTMDRNWEEMYRQLVMFRATRGHCKVTRKDDAKLAIWVLHQRGKLRNGTLPDWQKAKLDEIGFIWKTHDKTPWHKHLEALRAFKETHGHINLVYKRDSKDTLALFVRQCRVNRRKGKLAAELEAGLEELGLEWEPKKRIAEDHIGDLADFKRAHGHLHVPSSMGSLHRWLARQRKMHAKGILPEHMRRALLDVGYDVEAPPSRMPRSDATEKAATGGYSGRIWEERLAEAAEFHRLNGHFRVHPHKLETRTLYAWMAAQRRYRRMGTLAQEKIARLDAIGFEWGPKEMTRGIGNRWLARYEEAKGFHGENGHCKIPVRHPNNPRLGGWCAEQRRLRKLGRLSQDQIGLLDAIGFHWNTRDGGANEAEPIEGDGVASKELPRGTEGA